MSKLNEEHAYVSLGAEGLELGQEVHVVPNHACVVSNLFDRFTVVRGGSRRRRMADLPRSVTGFSLSPGVDARG